MSSSKRTPTTSHKTGVERKVKDACTEWNNMVLDWRTLNCKGLDVITTIANDLMSMRQQDVIQDVCNAKLSDDSTVLRTIFEDMKNVLEKMRHLTECMHGVSELELHRLNHTDNCRTATQPLFRYYSALDFYDATKTLLAMYEKEVTLKQAILENITLTSDHSSLVLLASSWQHQPYIDDVLHEDILNKLLEETGLK